MTFYKSKEVRNRRAETDRRQAEAEAAKNFDGEERRKGLRRTVCMICFLPYHGGPFTETCGCKRISMGTSGASVSGDPTKANPAGHVSDHDNADPKVVKTRLKRLKSLAEDGLITTEEFEKNQKALMANLSLGARLKAKFFGA